MDICSLSMKASPGLPSPQPNLGSDPLLFFLSGILRLAVSLLFLPHLHEVKKVTPPQTSLDVLEELGQEEVQALIAVS
jgi:hypothetical protein